MSDAVFRSLLVHQAQVERPSVGLDEEGAPATPVYRTLASGVVCRLEGLRAGSSDGLLGRLAEATHVLYLEPMDLRVADRVVMRPVQSQLVAEASAGTAEIELSSTKGMWAGAEIEVGSGANAELNMIAEVSGSLARLRDALVTTHEAGEVVSVVRRYEVLSVQDETGVGHHLRAVVKELG